MILKLGIFTFLVLFFCACSSVLTPATAPLNVYDAYSISRDKRGIYSITRDKFIQSKLQSKILFSKGLSNIDIEIECFYGDVYLIGLVDSKELEDKLVGLAKNTDGVREIYTYLRIKKPEYPCDSLKILANLKQNLFKDSIVEGTNVRVSIVGCDVVFSGVVDSIEQEKHAIWYAKHIDGVADVYSFIKVIK
ncbi:BON domain-containing protein [Campylobacter concisus]|jgi:putative transport-associated|uniref:BON domain-containing protein n=1 Tax=Campylobacter concisus TaxID=199 RepID=UPI000CD93EE5|nr:BON domain-containing protein [Campylobacter concisus]